MIKYLIFKYKIGRLFRKKDSLQKEFLVHYNDCKKKSGSRQEIEGIRHEERTELNIIEYEIEIITTSYFLKLASLNFIAIPDRSDAKSWIESSLDPYHKILSNSAISEIRSKIMNYRKERNEQLIPIITAITGLAGAIIGIVALCIK